jgi:hypothetical protein
MRCDEASSQFDKRLQFRGLELSHLAPNVGFSEMFAFYRDVRPVDCVPIEDDGDMLLYQWGTFDWGQGKYFNLNLTRQFIVEGLEDDDAIFQLGLTFFYAPSRVLEALEQGNRWCHSPAELADFEQFVFTSDAYLVGSELTPDKVELLYENVG